MFEYGNSNSDHRIDEIDLARLLKPVLANRASEAWPSQETLYTYMYGSPTEAEVKEVQQALALSPALQSALIDIAEINDWFSTNAARITFDSIEIPHMPLVDRAIKRARIGFWRRMTAVVQSFFERLIELLHSKPLGGKLALAPVAILALIAIIALIRTDPHSPIFFKEMDPAFLISSSTKGTSSSDEGVAYQSAETAAMNEFRKLVHYQVADKSFLYTTSLPSGRLDKGEEVRVKLRDGESGKEIECALSLPLNSFQGKEAAITLWILTTPDLKLWRYDLEDRSVTLDYNSQMGRNGVMTLTYKDADGYVAVPGTGF